MSDQGNIEERLEHYAKRAMPHYPNDLCSDAKREIERLRAELTEWQDDYAALKKSHATDLNDALSHLRAGIDKLRPMACETPIELHKACHALTHIVAQAEEAGGE